MSRLQFFRAWQFAAIAIAVAVLVWQLARTSSVPELLLFAGLVAAVSFLRIERDDEPLGFEAAVVFGCIMVFHDPGVALVAVFLGMGIHELWRDLRRRNVRIDTFHRPAQFALAYYVVALLYASAVAKDAPRMAKISGYILLLIGYLVAHLAFASMRRWLESGSSVTLDFRAVLLDQGKVLLIVSPIVAAEVMAYEAYGAVGFVLAFIPVLPVGYGLRRAEQRSAEIRELGRRNRELSILTESATQILSAEGDEETLRRMILLVAKLARLKACAIVTWDTNPDIPGTVFRFGECLPTDKDVLRYVESAGFAQSAPSRAFVFHNDMRRFPLSSGNAIQVIIGIQTTEIIYGILIYETEDPSILKIGSMNLLTLLVNQAAVSMQDQLLRREMREKTTQLEEQAETMSTILDVSNDLIGTFDVDQMLTRIAGGVAKSLGFEVVVFALYDPKYDVFVRRAHAGLDDVWDEVRKKPVSSSEITELFNQEFRVSDSFFISHMAMVQSERGFFVRPEDAPQRPEEWHENDMIITPLRSAERVIGYLSVRDPHDRRVPAIDKVRTLEIFAVQAVTGLQSARQYEEIRRLTFIDALTPAYNHRFFQEALAKEIHRHQRTGHEFALAMLDIDNFKRFNDTFGHPVGDEILKGLVDELMSNVRDIDVVARYGGEEFALIFPETPSTSAKDAGNRLRELVERREFTFRQLGRTLRITVSIGLAVFPADGETGADLIDRADAALYQAKKSGKNRVVLAEEVVGGGQLAL